MRGEFGDPAIMLGAADAAAAMLGRDQPPLTVARMAIGLARGFAEMAHRPGFLIPAQDAIIGDIAPQQATLIAEPYRTLTPAGAGVKPLHRREHDVIGAKARV